MIKGIDLSNWKRYRSFSLGFEDGLNFVLGPNGRGKTSVMQAISFALFGRRSMPDARDAISYGTDEAMVSLELDGDLPLTISRSIDSRGRIKESVMSAHKEADLDSFLVEKYRADPLFLQRLVLMPEGDIYRYGDGDPTIDRQLGHLLPLQDLIALQSAAAEAKKPLSRLQKEERRELQTSKDEEATLKAKLQELQTSLSEASDRYSKALEELKPLRERAERHRIWTQRAQAFEEWTRNWEVFLSRVESVMENLQGNTVHDVLDQLRNRLEAAEDELRQISSETGKIEGETEAIRVFIAALESDDEDHCPLCHQALSATHRKDVLEEQQSKLKRLHAERRTAEAKQAELENTRNDQRRLVAEAQGLLETRRDDPGPQDEEASRINEELSEAERQAEDMRIQIALLNEKISDTQQRLAVLEADRQAESRIVSAFREEALLSVIEKGLSQFMQDVRNSVIDPLAEELSREWKAYRPDAEWSLAIDESGSLCVKQGDAVRKFSSLSGGEKSVALILLRLAMTRSLTDADFLLLDEPFEHLDPRSRRLLMSSLYQATERGLIQQIIVSTYEEPVVRRLARREAVTALYLD